MLAKIELCGIMKGSHDSLGPHYAYFREVDQNNQ